MTPHEHAYDELREELEYMDDVEFVQALGDYAKKLRSNQAKTRAFIDEAFYRLDVLCW